MAKKEKRTRPWTKGDVRMLKVLACEKTKTTIDRAQAQRSVAAVYLRASKLAVALGGGRKKRARGSCSSCSRGAAGAMLAIAIAHLGQVFLEKSGAIEGDANAVQ